MSDETENANGKTEKLGIIPAEKINTVAGAKVWSEHRKNLTALAAAKEATATSKTAVLAALARSLKLDDPASLHFWLNGNGDIVVGRRSPEKVRRISSLRDLTAA